MPLAASVLLIPAICWLKHWLDRLAPKANYVSYIGTNLVLLLIATETLVPRYHTAIPKDISCSPDAHATNEG